MVAWIVLSVVLATGVLLGGAVLVQSWRLRRIARAIAADRLERPAEKPVLAGARARHEGTYFEHRGSRVPLPAWLPGVIGELRVTGEEIRFLDAGTLLHHIPLGRVVEPKLLPRFGELTADVVGGILQVDWLRGGHRVTSVFAIDGTRKTAENIRREIHLRAGQAPFPVPTMPTSV